MSESAQAPREIVVRYRSIDGCSKSFRYSTVEGAAKKVRSMLGEYFDIGSGYAVSGDGVATVTVRGASFAELGFES